MSSSHNIYATRNKSDFFSADFHLGHGNIIKYCNRPFLSTADKKALEDNGGSWHDGTWKGNRSSSWRISQEAIELMDKTIIDNVNDMVGENDELWFLGDFVFAPRDKYVRVQKRWFLNGSSHSKKQHCS